VAKQFFQEIEGRDAAEVLPAELPDPIEYESHRRYVRDVLAAEVDLRASGQRFIHVSEGEPADTLAYRNQMNADGSPYQIIVGGYRWMPGGELIERAQRLSEERRIH